MDRLDASLVDTVVSPPPAGALLGRARPESVVAILERVSDGIFFLDGASRFVHRHAPPRRALGRGGPPLLGRSLWEACPALIGSPYAAHYRRALATGEAALFEAYSPPTETWTEIHAYPARDGLAVYFHDITARKVAEARL